MRFARFAFAATLLVAPLAAQGVQPTNDAPNPDTTVKDFFKLPEGRTWGSTSAVDIDKDGKSIWVAERCGQNSCLDRATGKMSDLPTVLKFDPSGKVVKSFGAGMFIFPHGATVDRDGNLWVTDAGGDGAKGHQVFKFSPDGAVLMTLGKAGVSGSGSDLFDQPTTSSSRQAATSSSPTAIATGRTTAS